jgi:hypothetical protein
MQLDNPVDNYGDIPMDFDLGDTAFDAGQAQELSRSESVIPTTPRKRKASPVRSAIVFSLMISKGGYRSG